MTENLFRELEEKMMTVLAKLEIIQKENHRLQQENASLKIEREANAKKSHEFISLLDSVNEQEVPVSTVNITTVKPVLVQG